MHSGNKYNRYFIMLSESEQGFGKDSKPSGYVRIEIKNNVVKVLVHTQNLIVVDRDKTLEAYLLSSSEKGKIPFSLGKLALSPNGGDLICGFSIDELKRAGHIINNIDTAAVVIRGANENDSVIAFPLVGFKDEVWDFKKGFENKSISNVEKIKKNTQLGDVEERKNQLDDSVEEKTYLIDNIENKTQSDSEVKIKDEKVKSNMLHGYPAYENPFSNGDLGYDWYYIDNLRFILENEYSTDGIIYLMYNYNVMNAVYRYSHFLFGLRKGSGYGTRRVSFAVPSRYGIEPNPLIHAQAYARWTPKNGENSVTGALGYWVVVIDMDKNCFVI